jgi:hypothetical protein
VRFVVTGVGRGLASWVGAGCSTSEGLGGLVSTRRVGLTDTGPVEVVTPAHAGVMSPYAVGLRMVAAPGGTDLTWLEEDAAYPGGALLLAHVNAGGTAETPHLPADGWMPIGADAASDQVLQTVEQPPGSQPGAIAARAVGSKTVNPSPISGITWSTTAAGSTTGRTLIAATTLRGTLRVTTWAP